MLVMVWHACSSQLSGGRGRGRQCQSPLGQLEGEGDREREKEKGVGGRKGERGEKREA